MPGGSSSKRTSAKKAKPDSNPAPGSPAAEQTKAKDEPQTFSEAWAKAKAENELAKEKRKVEWEKAKKEEMEQVDNLGGSKMNAIASLLKDILKKKEKVLVFIQWDELQKVLVNTLQERLGFTPLLLCGSVLQRTNILRSFESSSEDEDSIMVMSLEGSTTGMDLTCANHVLLVHPMSANAETVSD